MEYIGDVCCGCDLCREQGDHIEDGDWNDMGWWCRTCISRGVRRTNAQIDWEAFAQDYPQFAVELKRLRKLAPR